MKSLLASFGIAAVTVAAANFGVRAEVISRIGGLTEGFYPVEDLEFSLRCWLNGIDVVGLPDAVVHYRYRDDPRTLWRQGWTYGLNRPRIGRLLRDAGQPTPAPFAGWRSWALLVLKFPTLVTRHGRANWLWIAANRLGQLLGSFRQRIVML